MKEFYKVFSKLKNGIFLSVLFFSPTLLLSQQATEIINYSSYQYANKNCGFATSPCVFNQGGTEILHTPGTAGSYSTTNGRFLFNHPNFKNNAIKKIVLEIQISKIFASAAGDAIMLIKMPYNACNNAVSWSGFPDYETLFNCNYGGVTIFQDGIGTGSNLNANLMIYDQAASGFQSQTLNTADPNSNSLTIAFTPFVGGLEISSAKLHITYDCTVPTSAPTLNASSNSTSSVNLSWSSVSGATNYEVYNCTTNQIVTTTSSTSFTVSGLSQATTYNYKVRAKNTCGTSDFSDCKSATTTGCSSAPASVISFTASDATTSSINLSWPSVSGATSYEIYNCDTNQLAATSTTTNRVMNGLNEGTLYNYKIRAKNSCGTSAFSGCISLTTVSNCTIAPTAPLSLTGSQTTNTSITLNWPSVNGATTYEIYNCDTNQINGSTNSSSYVLNNLSAGNTYSYKVRAKNSCGVSAFSSCTSTTLTVLGCPIPATPTSLASTIISYQSVRLTWDIIPSAEKYEIYDCNTNTLLNTAYSNNLVSYQATGSNYSYKVRAKNTCGNYSPFSNCITVVTSPNDGVGCDTPIIETPIVNLSQLSPSSVKLSWPIVPSAERYLIYDYNSRRIIGSSSSTSYVIENLYTSSNYLHFFVVRAQNSCGISAFSTQVGISTIYGNYGSCSNNTSHTPSAPEVTVLSDRITLNLMNTNFSLFDSYQIACCETGQILGTTNGDKFIIPMSELNPNQASYTFKVRGRDACPTNNTVYNSKYSSCSNTFYPVCNPICAMPQLERRQNSILFYWSDPVNYEYEIFDAVTNQIVGTSSNGIFTLFSLQPATEYQFKVRRKAFQNCSVTAFSPIIQGSTLGCRQSININSGGNMSGYWVASNITLGNTLIFPTSAVVIKAQNSITLLPGAYFQSGCNATIKIEGCIIPVGKQNDFDVVIPIEKDLEEQQASDNPIDNQDGSIQAETIQTANTENLENVLLEYKFKIPQTQSKLVIYPIPTKDILNITLENEFMSGQLSLYSISNELLLEKKVANTKESIDMTQFPSGVYLLKCTKGEKMAYSKIVKL